jgi:Ca-activated chloride channel family protein
VFFDQDIRISRFDSEDQQGLFDRINTQKVAGNTALYDAVAAYLSRVQDSPGRKVLLLFTDGVDSISDLSRADTLSLIRSSGVTFYVIAFTGGLSPGSGDAFRSRAFLDEAAALTGGRVFRPSASKDFPAIYDRILSELGSQYVLGFTSDRPGGDARYRRLKVVVNRPAVKVRHRAGYVPSELVR